MKCFFLFNIAKNDIILLYDNVYMFLKLGRIYVRGCDKVDRTKISYHSTDILFKYLSENFNSELLEKIGVKLPNIVEMLPNTFPIVSVDEKRADTVFKLEDGSILLLEFESNRRIEENKVKYLEYATRIIKKYLSEENKIVKIKIVVIYSSDINEAKEKMDAEDVVLNTRLVFMKNFDGNNTYKELLHKVKSGEEFDNKDLINCMLLPLMKHNKDRQEVIKDTIEIVKEIKSDNKQGLAMSGLLTAVNNIINEELGEEIRRWLKMTVVGRLYEKEKIDAINKTRIEVDRENAIKFAKKMLINGEDILKIMEYTELTEEEIEKLK
jgi:hypothetical protein